jgi:nucleotide-binding universal stress UspA family protein
MAWLPRKTVVVPIDFSDECFAALNLALEFVEEAAYLHVVHVLPKLSATDPGVIWGDVDDQSRRDNVETAVRERLARSDLANARVAVLFGNPGQEVAQYAARVEADLIVMPSHTQSEGRRLLVGSVTDRVVHLAHCPVLVLRS